MAPGSRTNTRSRTNVQNRTKKRMLYAIEVKDSEGHWNRYGGASAPPMSLKRAVLLLNVLVLDNCLAARRVAVACDWRPW